MTEQVERLARARCPHQFTPEKMIERLSAEKARAVLTQQAGDAANEGLRKQLAEARSALDEAITTISALKAELAAYEFEKTGGDYKNSDLNRVQTLLARVYKAALPAEQGEE
jgi:predicted translin family RNA/ssDNA-binding protein